MNLIYAMGSIMIYECNQKALSTPDVQSQRNTKQKTTDIKQHKINSRQNSGRGKGGGGCGGRGKYFSLANRNRTRGPVPKTESSQQISSSGREKTENKKKIAAHCGQRRARGKSRR
jgi:hypothetical protein